MIEYNFNIFVSFFLIIGGVLLAGRYFLYEDVVYIHDGKKRHSWKNIKFLNRTAFCAICEIMLSSNGIFCECCGCCACGSWECSKKSDSSIKCKERRLRAGENDKINKHLWVHGNLPPNSECVICGGDLDHHSDPGLHGRICAWCQRTVHDLCFPQFRNDDECDFGEFKDMIVPPKSILAARTKGAIKLHLTGVNLPEKLLDTWKPLIVVANSNSGGNEAAEVISRLRLILHPLQVLELGAHGPQEALQWAVHTAPRKIRILVAGGDGTVGWVLNTINSMKLEPHPEVCILPLGTGNDLSRVLGWGAEGPNDFDPVEYLKKIQKAEIVKMDRWLIEVAHHQFRFHLPGLPKKNIFMYNYFSVGVDALVTFNFHQARESKFYLLKSRLINKILYLMYGTHQVMQQDCIGLENNIELYLDDVKIDLPELQSVVVLNIDSWGAGVKLFEMSKEPGEIQSISDGILEVFGVISSFHIAQLQVGMSNPVKLGRAKSVRIKLNTTLPVQADGEPWLQTNCDITINHHGQATMLKSSK